MPRDEASVVDDAEIVAMLRAGGEEGLRQILRVYGPRVKWLLKDRFGDLLADLDAAAVLNEALLKVYTSIGMFDPSKGTLGTWFWRIAMNTARDLLRGQRRHRHEPLTEDPYEPGEPGESLAEEETMPAPVLRDLQEAIESLPDLQRSIIRADLACGGVAGAAWLARRYGTTESSIYVSRNKARENLRKAMRQRGHFQDK